MTTTSIGVRRADPQDARAIANVHRTTWIASYAGLIPHKPLTSMIERRREDWWRRATRGPSAVVVLEVGEKIVGYATIGANRVSALKQQGEIYELYLLPEYQGIGLGSYLFRECRGMLRALNMAGLVVWCLEENENAVTFYRAMGGMDVAEGMEEFGGRSLKKLGFIWKS